MEDNEMREWAKEHTGPGHRWEMTPKQQEANKAKNKKVLKWIGIGLAVLMLMAFCTAVLGGSGEPENTAQKPAETVTVPAEPKTITVAPKAPEKKPVSSREEAFYKVVDEQGVTVSHKVAINNAKNACRRLDNGDDTFDVATGIMENVGDPYQAGTIFGAGVAAFCPRHMDKVTELAGAGS